MAIEGKVCTRCNTFKTFDYFSKSCRQTDGYLSWCKDCFRAYNNEHKEHLSKIRKQYADEHKDKITEYNKNYYQQNKDKLLEQCRVYQQENKNKIAEYQRKYSEAHKAEKATYDKQYYQENTDTRKEYQKQYKEQNQDKVLAWREAYKPEKNRRRRESPQLRLDEAIGSAIWAALKGNKAERTWESLVNYTLEDLIKHLEAQFDENMSWDNYGFYGWHIDHIIPKNQFHYTSPEDHDFKICWSLMNLRPLWCNDNWHRGKYNYDDIPESLKQQILSQNI